MSNSLLVNYTKISPNKYSPRNHKIDTISIHCVVGQLSVETIGEIFESPSRKASSNYSIGSDARVGMYVEEKDGSWCTSSYSNDNRAITIEVASDTKPPYRIKDIVYEKLIELLVDICKRNNIPKLLWKGDKSLIGQVDKQNMTVHRWFANKSCPGDYLYNLHGKIAEEVNSRLSGSQILEDTNNTLEFEDIEVGVVYNFVGKFQYLSTFSNEKIPASPSKVKVTHIYLSKSPHPIHVRAVNDKGEFSSGVYGWVDLKDIRFTGLNPFHVRVNADTLNIRTGPGVSYPRIGDIRDKGVYTIIQTKDGWGQLKSKVGWISLAYTNKVNINQEEDE